MIEPTYGDVICVNHGIYNHFGIFVDKNHIIHYSGKNDDFLLRKMIIRETDIDDFLGDSNKYYVYKFSEEESSIKRIKAQGLDRELVDDIYALYMLYKIRNKINFKIYSPEETVKRARSRIGERKFSLASNNCEHFAMWCKTGVVQSYQVNAVLKAVFTKVQVNEY